MTEVPNKILEGIMALMESQGKHADALKAILERQEVQSAALAKMTTAMLALTPMLKELNAKIDRIERLVRPEPLAHDDPKRTVLSMFTSEPPDRD